MAVGTEIFLSATVPGGFPHRHRVELPLQIVRTSPLLLTKLTDMHCHAKARLSISGFMPMPPF